MKIKHLQKQEPIFIITKSSIQKPNIKDQKSGGIQAVESCGNSTVAFEDMLPSKQASKIDLFFTRRRHNKIDTY